MKAPFKLGLYAAGLAIVFGGSFTAAHLLIPVDWSSSWSHPLEHPATPDDNLTH